MSDADDRANLVETVQTHNADIAKAEKKLDNLVEARARAFKALNLSHGMSYREIAKVAGISHGAVLRALRKVGVDVGESRTKPGPKAHATPDAE